MPGSHLLQWHDYETPTALAAALAARIGAALSEAIATRDTATLAVSGGRTPKRLFEALSKMAIAWDRVTVMLVDERFVPSDDERSNEGLVRERLLQNEAKAAHFIPLYQPRTTIDEAVETANAAISTLPKPLDVAVLGMGPDGHTASFFPDAPNLDALIANPACRAVLPVFAESAVEPRLTLSMQILTAARLVILHIESETRRTILTDALAGNQLPIAQVFDRATSSPQIYWAP